MTEFGATLRQARERKGISLRQISTATKISMVVLESLERDDFSHLPGGIFSRAFVRAYAQEVGLDGDETVQQFLARFGEAEALRSDTETPIEISADDRAFLERQRKAASFVRIGAVLLLIAIIAAFSIWRMSRPKPVARLQSHPAGQTAARRAPASAASYTHP